MSEQKFKPAQPVLVRDDDKSKWHLELFSYYDEKLIYPYCCLVNNWKYCLPLEGNEHLLNTTDSLRSKWQPKPGELVAVSDDNKKWFAQVFISKVRGRLEGAYEASDTHDSSQPAYWQYCEPLCNHFNVPEE